MLNYWLRYAVAIGHVLQVHVLLARCMLIVLRYGIKTGKIILIKDRYEHTY